MINERLLERLRYVEQNPEHRGLVDPSRIVASIMRHLQKILNTRQGSVMIDEHYGVPDFTDLAASFSAESVRDLARAIKAVVATYEPRLSSIQIEAEPSGDRTLELRFKIEGRLRMDNNVDLPVAFETLVDPQGRIQVSQ